MELAAAIDVPTSLLDALTWPPDLSAIYQNSDVSAWQAWMWAAVASGDEYETGPPDVPSRGDFSVVRLGVSSADVILEDGQTTLESSTVTPDKSKETDRNVTGDDDEGPE